MSSVLVADYDVRIKSSGTTVLLNIVNCVLLALELALSCSE